MRRRRGHPKQAILFAVTVPSGSTSASSMPAIAGSRRGRWCASARPTSGWAALERAAAVQVATPAAGPPAPRALTVRLVWDGQEPSIDVEGRPTPDGRQLTFVDWTTGDLAVRDLTTGRNRRLTDAGYPEYALASSVSPDGRRVMVSFTMAGRSYAVGFVDIADGSTEIVRELGWRQPMTASLSPDGRYIVYDVPSGDRRFPRDIYLVAADGSFETPLVRDRSNDLHPIWAPDNQHVLFSSDRGGSIDLWAIRVVDGRPDGDPVLVKRDMAQNFFWPMGMTRDGAFFFAKDTGGGDIFHAPFDPATGRVVGEPARYVDRSMGYNTSPHVSRDGRRVAYVTRRTAASLGHAAAVVLHDLATGAELEASDELWVMRKTARPRWSPDGSRVLVGGRLEDGPNGLFRIDPATGAVAPIVRTVIGERGIGRGEWLPDGGSWPATPPPSPPRPGSDDASSPAAPAAPPATPAQTTATRAFTTPASPGDTARPPTPAGSGSPASRPTSAPSARLRSARSPPPRRTCTTAAWPRSTTSSTSMTPAATPTRD